MDRPKRGSLWLPGLLVIATVPVLILHTVVDLLLLHSLGIIAMKASIRLQQVHSPFNNGSLDFW